MGFISFNEHAYLQSQDNGVCPDCACRSCVLAKDKKQECADCQTIMQRGSGVIGGFHTVYGRYYLGPAICGVCSNSRYVDFITLMRRYDER